MKSTKVDRPTCGCGNTQDSNGYCDGSHATKQELNYEQIKKTKTNVLVFLCANECGIFYFFNGKSTLGTANIFNGS